MTGWNPDRARRKGIIMKRLAWMLVRRILGLASQGQAYTGPGTPLTYDRLINGIRVVMTVQPRSCRGATRGSR